MRILYLIDNFSLGGAQTVVKGLMECSEATDTKYAFALREKKPLMSIEHPNSHSFPSSSKYTFRVVRYLKNYISENNIDVLHCQLPRSILTGYILKRIFPHIKYIIHEQGDVFESRVYAMLLRMLWKRADGILACSMATANMLVRRSHVDSGKIKVLYNFVDPDRFSPGQLSETGILKIAFAGRIEKRKGWREFIGAAINLRNRKELSFHLAGTGTEVKKLKRAIGKQKDVTINYWGYVSDMKTFYQEMDLLVIPSHFEPMGMVAVEAMACGIPVLAADVPGLNEVVHHQKNGWTYAGSSAGNLSRTITDLLEGDPAERKSIIDRGIQDARRYALEEFSKELHEFHSTLKP